MEYIPLALFPCNVFVLILHQDDADVISELESSLSSNFWKHLCNFWCCFRRQLVDLCTETLFLWWQFISFQVFCLRSYFHPVPLMCDSGGCQRGKQIEFGNLCCVFSSGILSLGPATVAFPDAVFIFTQTRKTSVLCCPSNSRYFSV